MLAGKSLKEIAALVEGQVVTAAEALAHAERVATHNADSAKGKRWAAFAAKLRADGVADYRAAFAAAKPKPAPKAKRETAPKAAEDLTLQELLALLLKKVR